MASDPPPVERDFKLQQFAYGSGQDEIVPNRQKYWRISLFFQRKEGVSAEFFARHWHHVHADLVTSTKSYCENNILRYNQFHQSPEGLAKAHSLGYGESLPFDAVTEFWVKDVEQFKAFTKSKEFELATPDIHNFINVETGVKVMIGYDNLVYGDAVPGYGEDGLVRKDLEKLHGKE